MNGKRAFVHSSGIVGNIVAHDDSSTQCPEHHFEIGIEQEEIVGVGWNYDANADPRFFFVHSSIAASRWTAYQFLLRFTAEERAAFRAAAITDPNVADFQQLAQAAQEVLSDDPMTVAGMAYLVSVGLLTSARRDEILGG